MISELKSYSGIRKFTTPEAFRAAMTYISWHNRLVNTHMLEPWEALVVTYAYELKPIDTLLFGAVKSYLDRTREPAPESIEDCRTRANLLSIELSAR